MTKQTREEYLAGSLSKNKPWEAEGICRRTWERRRRSSGVASPVSQVLPGVASPVSQVLPGVASPVSQVLPGGTAQPALEPRAKTKRGRKARTGDDQIARWIDGELAVMGTSAGEPKVQWNAVERVKKLKLSELDRKRSTQSLIRMYQRRRPQLDADKWIAQLQRLDFSAEEASKLIDSLRAVAEPSGGRDYIDDKIIYAVNNRQKSKKQNRDWLWWLAGKMERQPGYIAQPRPEIANSASLDRVLAELGDVPRHRDEIAKAAGLTSKEACNRLACLRRGDLAFSHGHGFWARTRPEKPPLYLSDKIWTALDDGREAHPAELARDLQVDYSVIHAELSRMAKGVNGKKVVRTPDGKFKRWTPGAVSHAFAPAWVLILKVLADGLARSNGQLADDTGRSPASISLALHGVLLPKGKVRAVFPGRNASYVITGPGRRTKLAVT